jgi:hypothetical protein
VEALSEIEDRITEGDYLGSLNLRLSNLNARILTFVNPGCAG